MRNSFLSCKILMRLNLTPTFLKAKYFSPNRHSRCTSFSFCRVHTCVNWEHVLEKGGHGKHMHWTCTLPPDTAVFSSYRTHTLFLFKKSARCQLLHWNFVILLVYSLFRKNTSHLNLSFPLVQGQHLANILIKANSF